MDFLEFDNILDSKHVVFDTVRNVFIRNPIDFYVLFLRVLTFQYPIMGQDGFRKSASSLVLLIVVGCPSGLALGANLTDLEKGCPNHKRINTAMI